MYIYQNGGVNILNSFWVVVILNGDQLAQCVVVVHVYDLIGLALL